MPASKFCWYELMTTDTAAAERYYTGVVGWKATDAGMGADIPYTILLAGETPIGGLTGIPAELAPHGVAPHWAGYIAVDDVDATAERVHGAGGQVLRPGSDIPNVGRFAVVADPQGAAFILFRGAGEAPPEAPPGTPGTVGWHELTTTDGAKALAFYTQLFGWKKGEPIDMGEMGVYQIFEIDGVPSGGIMNRPAGAPGGPAWGFYVNVPEIQSAIERVKAGGGQVVNGPMQVPGGSWIINAVDPQGAVFALVSPGKPA